MKQRKGDERIVFQSLTMVTQFGINMIVPICMMSAFGIWLDGKLGTTWLTILFCDRGSGGRPERIPHGEAHVQRGRTGQGAEDFR